MVSGRVVGLWEDMLEPDTLAGEAKNGNEEGKMWERQPSVVGTRMERSRASGKHTSRDFP